MDQELLRHPYISHSNQSETLADNAGHPDPPEFEINPIKLSEQIDQFIRLYRPSNGLWKVEHLAQKLGEWSIQYAACKAIFKNFGLKENVNRKGVNAQALIMKKLLNFTTRTPKTQTLRSPATLPSAWPKNNEQVKVLLIQLLNLSDTQKSILEKAANLAHPSRKTEDNKTQIDPEIVKLINSLREICLPLIQKVQMQSMYEIMDQILLQSDTLIVEKKLQGQFETVTEILWEKLKTHLITSNIKPDHYFEYEVKQYLREITTTTMQDYLKKHSLS